jgi:hypothetical protein
MLGSTHAVRKVASGTQHSSAGTTRPQLAP